MEDLAYIYLALNDEIERSKDLDEDTLPNPYSIWAPPIPSDLDHDSHPSPEQADDTDSTFQPYQGFFYL